ncbi:hypothetical protein QW131_16235 [Roseibium salinum]|nr:hypothetical protein [Roseibium salinum]
MGRGYACRSCRVKAVSNLRHLAKAVGLPAERPVRPLHQTGRAPFPVDLSAAPAGALRTCLVGNAGNAGVGPGRARLFFRNCKVACQDSLGSPDICEAACTCTLAQLKADDLWTSLNEEPENQALLSRMRTAYTQCLADPETRPGTVN